MNLINDITDERRIAAMKELEKGAEYSHKEIDPMLVALKDKIEMFNGEEFARDIIKAQIVLYIGRI